MEEWLGDINPELVAYCEREIVPRYDAFDRAHRRDHVRQVAEACLQLARYYPVDRNMVYAAAVYHDTGLAEGRDTHHLASGRIIRSDTELRRWFTEEQVETIAQAAEDHRASGKDEPRSIYGKIVAEGDRRIVPEEIVRRTIQYGLAHYPALDKEGQWQRDLAHLQEKYGHGGYLRLWLPESPNAARLAALRALIGDTDALRALFDNIYAEEAG